VFEIVMRRGSITRAAEELKVSQVAVSRIISRLEKALDTRLFTRSRSGLTPTDDGAILLTGVSQGLAAINDAIEQIRARQQRVQNVTISLSSAFIAYWLMPRYQLFQKALPNINLRFHVISGALGPNFDDFDLALRHSEFLKKSQQSWFFAPEVIIPVCSQSYLQTRGPLEKPKSNQTHMRIELSPTTVDWVAFSNKAEFHDIANSQPLSFSDYALVLQAAMLGRGIALGWLSSLTHSLRAGELVPASQHIVATGSAYYLMSNQRTAREEVQRVQAWFCEQMQSDLKEVRQAFSQLREPINSALRV
jgi:DNA-binding transcriptional LysR family regulator